MLSDTQTSKVIAALQPLYEDPEFSEVTDMTVSVSQTPPPPTPVVDVVDVTK